MNGIEQLEALNPVPDVRGNPGPLRNEPEATTRGGRGRAVLAIAAAAVLLVALGSFALRSLAGDSRDIEVAIEMGEGEPTQEEPLASAAERDDATVGQQAVTQGSEGATDEAVASAATTTPDETPLGRLVIPAIDLDLIVGSGVGVADLRRGVGHYPESSLPGQAGNVAIAGHRTTYGALFWRLDELAEGDSIFATTAQGVFEYQVAENTIVDPADTNVLRDFGDNRLTLTTGHPPYSNRQRIVVVAQLIGEPAPTMAFEEILDALTGVAAENAAGADSAPDISDLAFDAGRHPYYSFRGSTNALQSARAFVSSQFPDWDHDGALSLAVHEETLRSASVRWVDTRHDTAGWITLSSGDGQFWVFDMTMDGVGAGASGSPERAFGWVTSDVPIAVDVMAPIPVWLLPGRPVSMPRATTTDILATTTPKETALAGLTANFRFDDVDDVFQEVRFVIRNEDGDQIGGAATSLLPVERGLGLIVDVDDLIELEALLSETPLVSSWVVTDRFQSVEQLRLTAPDLAPTSIDELPGYVFVRVIAQQQEPQAMSDEERELSAELLERFDQGAREALAPAPGTLVALTEPATRYVVDELPAVARCIAWPAALTAPVVVNQVRRAAATPAGAIRAVPLALQGRAIEFVNADGLVLGYAQAAPNRPWTFIKVITVEPVDGGWVTTQWQNAGC